MKSTPAPAGYLSDAGLHAYQAGDLTAADAKRMQAHLKSCAACAQRVASLAAQQDEFLRPFRGLTLSETQAETTSSATTNLAPAANKPHMVAEPTDADRNRYHLPPDACPGYEVLAELSRGGQGVVYKAIQKSTKREVAIKVLREGPFAGPHDQARFEREVEILGQLKHPHIVTIHDSGAAAGHFYFVMDYIPGQSLDAWMANWSANAGSKSGGAGFPSKIPTPKSKIRETLALFAEICEAVNVAHLRGIIHRDLKPSNIRIDPAGQPHILDFGLAKLSEFDTLQGSQTDPMTRTGQFIGSLPWSAPEQAAGLPHQIDLRTDVYALGVILYQMLTGGQFPYPVQGHLGDVLNHIRHAAPVPPRKLNSTSMLRGWIDDEVETIVLRCLNKEQGRRYQTAGELARDVRHYLNNEPIEAKRDSPFYVLKKTLRRYRGSVLAGALVVLALIGGLIASLLTARWALDERTRAVRAEGAAAASAKKARTEANRAEAINEFLLIMLGSADLRELGREAKVTQVLEWASKTVGESFKDQPDVEAGIHGILGKTYESLGMLDEAERHVQAALALNQQLYGENSLEAAESLRGAADLAGERGQWAEAENLMRAAAAIIEKIRGANDSKTQGVQSDLANILRKRKKYDEAEALYRGVLKARRAADPRGRDMQIILNSLAVLMHDQERLDEAEALYREALELGEQAFGPDDPDTLTTRANWASLLHSRGRWEEAEALFVETAKRMRRVFGDRHPKTTTTLNALAKLLENRGRFREALPLYREVLEIRRSLQGDRSNDVVDCKIALANVLCALNDDAAAIALRREVLDQRQESLGEENSETIAALIALGNALSKFEQKTEAEPLLRRAAELALRVLGPENQLTAVALNSFAVHLHSLDRLDEAEPLYRKALEAGRRGVGENHHDTIITMHNLTHVLRERGKLEEAETLGRDALERFQRVIGAEHPNTAVAYNSLAKTLKERGQLAEAETLFKRSLAIRRARLGDRNPDVAETLVEIGLLRVDCQDAAGAEAPLREALDIRQTVLGKEHAQTAKALSALGKCLTALNRLDEAESLLLEGYRILAQAGNLQHKAIYEALERLIHLYEIWETVVPDQGHDAQAAVWRTKLEEWQASTQPTSSPAVPSAPPP